MKSKYFKAFPECVYGNQSTLICVDSQCSKPAFICQHGIKNHQECFLFHQNCQKMKWSEFQNIFYQNPKTKAPNFIKLQDQMENLFSNLIKKIKDEHLKFKMWSRYYGYSEEMNNFINKINQAQFNKITGVKMNHLLSQIFIKDQTIFDLAFSKKSLQTIYEEIQIALEKITDLYSFDQKLRTQSSGSTNFLRYDVSIKLKSSITDQTGFIESLFKKAPSKFTLIYKASENQFSANKFHQLCGEIPHTLLVVRTQFDKIIGGYTPITWNSGQKRWIPDKSLQSFIFSLDLKQKFQLNLAQFAIASNPQKGPIFGCCDICIVDKSYVQKSSAEFPISYNNFKYARNSDTSLLFTGSPNGKFLTLQWEVFHVEFE